MLMSNIDWFDFFVPTKPLTTQSFLYSFVHFVPLLDNFLRTFP